MISRDKQDEVLRLYDEGRTVKDIMQATGIRSTATIYRIVKESRATRTRAGEFRVTVTLPEELKPFVEQQEDFSKFVNDLIYSRLTGVNPTPSKNDFGGTKVLYRPIDPYSENAKIGMPPLGYSDPNVGSEDKDFEKQKSVLADLTVIFYDDCATIHTTKLTSYIDEEVVNNLVLWYGNNNEIDYDEVAIYNGDVLLWLWRPVVKDGSIVGLEF